MTKKNKGSWIKIGDENYWVEGGDYGREERQRQRKCIVEIKKLQQSKKDIEY